MRHAISNTRDDAILTPDPVSCRWSPGHIGHTLWWHDGRLPRWATATLRISRQDRVMMPRLIEHPAALRALIQHTARAQRLPARYVEHDFCVTEVLRAACPPRSVHMPDDSVGTVTFIFKGGTSLSRVFHIIHRFSEDLDLMAVFPLKASKSARHKVLKAVDRSVREHLGSAINSVTVGPSSAGVKRYTRYHYPTVDYDPSRAAGVLLELGSRGGTRPTQQHAYRSLLAHHALEVLAESPSAWQELAAFQVNVLRPERTLYEKLAAVHDAASRQHLEKLTQHGRHFYDIHQLLQDPGVLEALKDLGPSGRRELAADIERHSVEAGFATTPRPTHGYGDSPAFNPDRAAYAAIEVGYTAARSLVFGSFEPLSVVLELIRSRRDLL